MRACIYVVKLTFPHFCICKYFHFTSHFPSILRHNTQSCVDIFAAKDLQSELTQQKQKGIKELKNNKINNNIVEK